MNYQSLSTIATFMLSSIFLFGCAQANNPNDKASWVDTADPIEDASNAVKRNDYRLLGLAMRAIKTPGIKSEDQENLIEKCGVRFLQGSGDVIRGKQDLEFKKALRKYAESYNVIIKPACEARDKPKRLPSS